MMVKEIMIGALAGAAIAGFIIGGGSVPPVEPVDGATRDGKSMLEVLATPVSLMIEAPCVKLAELEVRGEDGVVVQWVEPSVSVPVEEGCERVTYLDVLVGEAYYEAWRCTYEWGIHIDWRQSVGCE